MLGSTICAITVSWPARSVTVSPLTVTLSRLPMPGGSGFEGCCDCVRVATARIMAGRRANQKMVLSFMVFYDLHDPGDRETTYFRAFMDGGQSTWVSSDLRGDRRRIGSSGHQSSDHRAICGCLRAVGFWLQLFNSTLREFL